MRTTVVARRYLPLAAVLGVLLLIVAVFPSTGTTSVTSSTAAAAPAQGYSVGAGAPGGGDQGASTVTTPAAVAGTAGAMAGVTPSAAAATGGAATTGGSSGPAAVTASGSAARSSGGASSGGGAPAAQSGDTTHCVGGREFDPAIDYFAPPCTPGTPGAADPANGGATSAGVTPNQIEVVDFQTNYGAVINAVLQAEGLYVTAAEAQQLDQAWQNFINAKYVLWGRKLHVDTYVSQCTAAPPDLQCLLPEMDKVAATYHPFAVVWATTVCSACYAELAKDGVIGVGGTGFTDSFSNQLAPYFYSAGESSTRTITAFAQFWCNQLSSVNQPSRTVAYAQHVNNLQDFNGKPRSLGVVTPNDADNENAVTQVLIPALQKGCGDGSSISTHHYFYAQDASTVAQQTQAAVSAMDTPQNPATAVLCLCDAVAPAFLYGGFKSENYWPEQVVASDQGQDFDSVGQSYESGQACSPGPPCEWDTAYGLSSEEPQLPTGKDPGLAAYAAGGGSGQPVSGLSADTGWANFEMLASLIENTGPALTPARMLAAAPTMGTRGGGASGHREVGFAPGSVQWQIDDRVAYWDKGATSSYDGKPGTWVQVAGTPRYVLGQYPVAPGGPSGIPKAR